MEDKKVRSEDVNALLDSAETQEHIFWGKELVVSYKLPCGFTVAGRGACIDPSMFDLTIGRKVAREDALHQLWKLEGYVLRLKLSA
jgi:Tfp pilus assembly ATPase PilU